MYRAVFDTNIVIDYINGTQSARQLFDSVTHPYISIIVYIEILVGLQGTEHQKAFTLDLLTHFKLINMNMQIAHQTVQVKQQHRLKLPDAIIYATALDLDAYLLTRNTQDFKPEWCNVHVPYEVSLNG